MLTREQMARLAAREIADAQRVYFGPGLPQAVQAVSPRASVGEAPYDVAFVEALEVASNGALTLAPGTSLPEAKRLVAVLAHTLADGAPRIRAQEGQGPRAERLVSDRAVIDVTPAGLVLRELLAGLSAADVQAHTAAPLLADASLAVIAV
jgi:acyl CoA:acetate/3-ketoacid CoA transferase beta subunit